MAAPSRLDTFAAQLQGNTLVNVQAVDVKESEGTYVSSAARSDHPSPLLFTLADRVVTILKGDRPAEMRVQGSNLRFVREGEEWTCFRGEESLGKIRYPTDEKAAIDAFGSHWDQFVVPLIKPDGSSAFVMIPYEQSIDRQGNMSVNKAETMPAVEVLTVTTNGTIKGSAAAHLYLAHERLLEASKAKTPETARTLYLQAQKHLDVLATSRPAKDADAIQSLTHVTNLLQKTATVALKPMPTVEALSMSIRLGLAAKRAQEMAKIPLSISNKFTAQETLASQFHAYNVLKQKGEFSAFNVDGKAAKKTLILSPNEESQLNQIQQSLLTNTEMPDGLEAFFGGQLGSLETNVTLSRTTHLDPQFLLALLRSAKPVTTPPIDIRQIHSPIPVEMLVENFWNYAASIRENGLTPDQLMVLFSPSVMAPGRNPEEAKQLATIDQQARQFLLAIADLETVVAEIKANHPKDALDVSLEKAKAQVKDYLTDEALLLLAERDVGLGKQFSELRDSLQQLEGVAVTKKFSGTDVRFVDMKKLTQDLNAIETQLSNLGSAVSDFISKAENIQSNEIDKPYKTLTDSLETLQKSHKDKTTTLEDAVPEDQEKIQEELDALQEQIEAKELEIKNYLEEETQVPMSGEACSREELLHDGFLIAIDVPRLREVVSNCEKMDKQLVLARKDAQRAEKAFDAILLIEKMNQDISALRFNPQPNLKFPEGEAGAAFIDFLAPGGQVRDVQMNMGTVKELFQKVGWIEGARLAENRGGRD